MYSRKNALETALRAAALLLAVGTSHAAWADSRAVFMNFSDPGNPSEARVTIQFEDTAKPDGDPNKYRYVIATIPPGRSATSSSAVSNSTAFPSEPRATPG